MLFASAVGIIVEVIHHQARPVLGKHNVQLQQKAADGGRDSALSREGEKHVGTGIDEFDDRVGCQSGTETFRLGGEEEQMGVGGLAVFEEGEFSIFGGAVGDLEASCFGEWLADVVHIAVQQ